MHTTSPASCPSTALSAGPSTLAQWLFATAGRIQAAGHDAPRLCAELIACHVLGIERKDIVLHPARPIGEHDLPLLESLVLRRLAGEPMAYILGEKEFYGRSFTVNQHTLIPRPDSELLIDTVCSYFANTAQGQFADLGTGSGALAISLALEKPGWKGVMVDISRQALHCAHSNSLRYGLEERVHPLLGDFSRQLFRENSLDLLLSNPPYIGEAEYATLEPGVRLFEPRHALVPSFFGPASPQQPALDGYEAYRVLAAQAPRVLRPGGLVCVECGWQQARHIELLFLDNNLENTRIICDLAGHERLVYATKRC